MIPAEPATDSDTLTAILNSGKRVGWWDESARDDWQARIEKTRELIALSRSVLAEPLPVGAFSLVTD